MKVTWTKEVVVEMETVKSGVPFGYGVKRI